MFATKDGKRHFDDKLKKLIEQCRNVEIRSLIGTSSPALLIDSTGTTLLHLSAKYNNHLLTKYLVRHGCEIDARDNGGATPLLLSATHNSFKSAAVLLDANADVCSAAANDAGRTALRVFLDGRRKVPAEIVNRCLERVKSGSESSDEVAEKLMSAGCSLELVVRMSVLEVTKIVIESGYITDEGKFASAMYLAMRSNDLENTELLLGRVDEVSVCELQLLEFVARVSVKKATKKGLRIVDSLLGKVKDWQSLDEQAITFLESIAENGSRDAVKILLENNVDARVRAKFPGHELLAHVFANPQVNILTDLLKKRSFDVNCRGKSGNTALKLAVKNRVVGNVQLLLDMSADPNVPDDDGWVPLFEALGPKKLEADDKRCVELLLQYGAEVQLANEAGQTVVDWALVNGDFTLLEPVLAHLAISEALGQPILPKIRQQINVFRHLKVCYETYGKQLDRMRQHEIYPDVTLFAVLTGDSEKIAAAVKNPMNIAVLLQSNAIRRFHWYYVSTLKKRFEQAMAIVRLREKAAQVVAECSGRLGSKDAVVEKIIGYLSYGDLCLF